MTATRLKKKFSLRRWLLLPLWLSMAAAAGWYCYNYRFFAVDDRSFDKEIAAAAAKYDLDPDLVRAVVYEESRFNPREVDNAGEIGLMQIMPKLAAADWAKANKQPLPTRDELFDPELNLEIGCWYLSDSLKRFKDYKYSTELALARYNAGLSKANSWVPKDKNAPAINNITFPGTKKYVTNIMARYQQYCHEAK